MYDAWIIEREWKRIADEDDTMGIFTGTCKLLGGISTRSIMVSCLVHK